MTKRGIPDSGRVGPGRTAVSPYTRTLSRLVPRALLHHFIPCALHLFDGHSELHGRDDPVVAEGVFEATGALTIEVIRQGDQFLRARIEGTLERRIHILDIEA